MDKTFKLSFDLTQQQLKLITDVIDSNILANQVVDQASQFIPYTDISLNNDIQPFFDHEMCSQLIDEINTDTFYHNQIIKIIPKSKEKLIPQNTFQHNMENNNLNQAQVSVQIINSSVKPKAIDNVILTSSSLFAHSYLDPNVLIPNTIEVNQNQSKSVTPIVYKPDPNAYIPNDIMEMENDLEKSNKIQIRCQPRSTFRPRTQNESKNSSHYLRCKEGAEYDYPTIYISPAWATQSDFNVIEVVLMDIEKRPHPYVIDNKTSKNPPDNETLIWKDDKPNVLYFRLTNEDFVNGYKSFMIELIKSKQDHVITKELIRTRQLDQSMLSFTRWYRDQNGTYHRDDESQEYSCIMTENYGGVSVENVGPRCGPMCGQEMLFISFKGRIAKGDVSVIIYDQRTSWLVRMEDFTINGNFIHFLMPAFPHRQMNRAIVTITIYFKKQAIDHKTYLYTNLLDQELSNLNSVNNLSMVPNSINHFQGDMLFDTDSSPLITQQTSENKPQKRLKSK